MKLLLDTCTFLWLILDSDELSAEIRGLVANPLNEVQLSAVSTWEIALEVSLGRLPLPKPADAYIQRQRERHGVDFLALDELSALHLLRLPALHQDPFDRMLVCQALVHGLTVVTPDHLISQYPVRVVW